MRDTLACLGAQTDQKKWGPTEHSQTSPTFHTAPRLISSSGTFTTDPAASASSRSEVYVTVRQRCVVTASKDVGSMY